MKTRIWLSLLAVMAATSIVLAFVDIAHADGSAGSGSAITSGSGSGSALVVAHDAPLAAAGSGSAASAPSADQLHNPAQDPIAALGDLKAMKRLGWPAVAFGFLIMLARLLIWAKTGLVTVPLLGKLAAWLSIGTRAIWVASIGAGAAVAYNALLDGGTAYAAFALLVAKVFALMNPFGAPVPKTA